MRRTCWVAVTAGAMVALTIAPAGSAIGSRLTASQPGTGVHVKGTPRSETGVAVAAAGDVNGDGTDDIIVGADASGGPGGEASGAAYVIFGGVGPSDVSVTDLAGRGFAIRGAAPFDFLGWSVAAAGDVNGDGLDDVVVGAPKSDHRGGESGSAYVVFGKTDDADVSVAAPGEWGYRIDGFDAGQLAGWSVAGAGDVNGDGRSDVLVGSPGAGTSDRAGTGFGYVVYGRMSGVVVDLGLLGMPGIGDEYGYRMVGARADDETGWSVARAGDVNDDGRPDALVGAPLGDANGSASGRAYVVFGQDSTEESYSPSIDLRALGKRGVRIDGPRASAAAGFSVAGSGDINGDAAVDLVIGAPGLTILAGAPAFASSSPMASSSAPAENVGTAFVVFGDGGRRSVDLKDLGERGIEIAIGKSFDRLGHSVAALEDIDGDGKDEYLVGAPQLDRVFLGLGRGAGRIDPASPRGHGTWIHGRDSSAAGWSISSAGDFDGDGRADTLLGEPDARVSGEQAGRTTIITNLRWRIVSRPDRRWSPRVSKAMVGDSIEWSNRSSKTVVLRSYVDDSAAWRLYARLSPGESVRRVFHEAGVYRFRDATRSDVGSSSCTGSCGRLIVRG